MVSNELTRWITRLRAETLPSFARTTKQVATLVDKEDCTANDLAHVILQDSVMTEKVLGMINNVYSSLSGKEIDTVSFATVMLGVTKVRNIAVTVAMLETLLDSKYLKRVHREVIFAYHAALLAQAIAVKKSIPDTESVYISALLHRLGHIIFWCFPYEFGRELEVAYANSAANPSEIEKSVLGFSLSALTAQLAEEWHLNNLLDLGSTDKNKVQCISQAYSLANVVRHGWDTTSTQLRLKSIAKLLNYSVDEIAHMVEKSIELLHLGIGERELLAKLPSKRIEIPDEKRNPIKRKKEEKKKADVSVREPEKINSTHIVFSESDHQDLRNRLLRQLTHMLIQTIDLNRVLFAVLEGIKQAVYCDQSFILLHNTKTHKMFLHQHIGAESESIAKKVSRLFDKAETSVLRRTLYSDEPCWPKKQDWLKDLYQDIFHSNNYFIYPLVVHEKKLGYIFAIRTQSKPELNEQDFDVFTHFCDHANIALRLLTR